MRLLLTSCAVLFTTAAWADIAPPKPAAKPAPAAPAAAPAKEFFTVGLVASLNDEKARAQVDALAGFVGGTVGKTTRGRIFHDYDELADAVSKGELDVALMGPLAFLRVDPKAKASLLLRTVRRGKATYRAVLFAKANSPLKGLDAVRKAKNLKVGWVDASSATGYLIPKAFLLQSGINPVEIFEVQDFAGSHDAVCTGVAEGKWDLGATFADDPAPAAPKASGCALALGKKADALTIVAASGEIPNDVLVASGAFPKELADKLVAAAKGLAGSDAGKKTLASTLLAEGVADVTSADFEPVRKALDAFHRP